MEVILLNKNILTFGIIILFIVSALVPISIGYNVKTLDMIEQLSYLGNTSYLGGCSDSNYLTINSAVGNVDVVVNKTVNLVGEGKTCYGYQVYPNPDRIISFYIDDPNNLNIISGSNTSDKIAGSTWVDGVWWCCEYSSISNSKIWIIDHLTGDMTLIGESGEGLNGLAFDDTTNTMYACSSTHLFSIDMENGAATMIGAFGISGCVMVGIACNRYGDMYGEDLHTDSLYSIDLVTGEAILIGSFGLDLNYGQDIAFDKETGICYLSAFTVHDGNEGALYICNITNGVTTKIGNFGLVTTQITGFSIPYNLNNPPTAPTIDGPTSGKPGIDYNYTFSSFDPDVDDLLYIIDWGDNETTETNCYSSGMEIEVSHTYSQQGTYMIRTRAKECPDGLESPESTLSVTMPIGKIQLFNMLLQYMFERFPKLFPLMSLLLQRLELQ